MKIAIFQNFLDNIGGAEILGLTMARELNADIYTTNIDKEKIKKMGFHDINIKSIGHVTCDWPQRYKSTLKLFRNLNLKNKYDFYIISGEWAMSGAVNNKPNLLYSHHLIKEAWDQYYYLRDTNFDKWPSLINLVISLAIFNLNPLRAIYKVTRFDLITAHYRFLTKKYIKHVNKIICNSQNTKKTIKKYLNKNSYLLYPPTETNQFKYIKNGNFWLSVNRLYPNKGVDIQVKAFRELPKEKLIIVGSYENSPSFIKYKDYIEKIKPKNVEIVSSVDQESLIELYSNCKGVISTAKDEDFGMTAVEAMASGKPVIAPNEGGYKETIINDVTGKLIGKINEDKLIEAIKEVGKNPRKYKEECIKQAKKFDTKIFINELKKHIKNEIH